MRKEDKLLPPPTVDPSGAEEMEALSKFMMLVLIGGILGVLVTSVVYGTALYSVITVLESSDAVSWKLTWAQSFFIAIIFQFVRAWDRSLKK